MRRTTRLCVATLIATVTLLSARPFASPQDDAQIRGRGNAAARAGRSTYIVRLAELPVIAYQGGIPGFQGTKAPRGQKVDRTVPDVIAYGSYLSGRHDLAIAAVGGGRKLYDYQMAFNGFAAELTDDQAGALRTISGIVSVEK